MLMQGCTPALHLCRMKIIFLTAIPLFMTTLSHDHSLKPADALAISRAPGIQYLLVSPNEILQEINTGFADVETQRAVTPACTFNAYSITKTFTAIAVLQLAEQGKIALTDTAGDLLPEYRFSGKFTVEQILSHRAGLANPLPLSWIHLAGEAQDFDVSAFSHRIIAANTRLKYRPGTKTSYSNVGYLILGELIERVSGLPYQDYVRQNIFKKVAKEGAYLGFKRPLSGENTNGYHKRRSFSNLLLGFLLDKKKYTHPASAEWLAFEPSYVNGTAYGGIVANARGLAAYLQAVLKNELFENPATAALLFGRQEPGMGLGWFTGSLNDQVYYTHAGGGGGYYCEIRIYPALQMASVLMTNRSGFSDERLLDKIDQEALIRRTVKHYGALPMAN